MGFLGCNARSAISTCDSCYGDLKNKPQTQTQTVQVHPHKIRYFSYQELLNATNDFSTNTFLGKGSHGNVYKALLDNGNLVTAVKITKPSIISSNSPEENEIEILSRIRNPALVNLVGVCTDTKKRKLIIVEYMPNGSLYDLLHSNSSPPNWKLRIRLALQVAKAVETLHVSNPPVIHRDIKSSNILIDEKFHARLGDFGLAVRGHIEELRMKCTPPAGTLGYLDPEYLSPADLSFKSDVFSFGILLFEIITGRKAIDFDYSPPFVVEWAVPMVKRSELSKIYDGRIGAPPDPAVIRFMAVLATRCVRSKAEERPEMAEIVEYLTILSKLVHTPATWNNVREKVRRVRILRPLIKREQCRAEVVKGKKPGSRRNRQISSVSRAEYESGVVDRAVRSKSVGSTNDQRLHHPAHGIPLTNRGARSSEKYKTAASRSLRKSKSMGPTSNFYP